MLRPLRIAVSVVSGICCVLLIVLWVRSYRHEANSLSIGDRVSYYDRANRSFSAESWNGAFHFNLVYPEARLPWKATRTGIQASDVPLPNHFANGGIFGFDVSTKELSSDIRVPCWSSVLFATIVATMPWIRWSYRFSLRTLLIATTLFAVGLGVVVWMAT